MNPGEMSTGPEQVQLDAKIWTKSRSHQNNVERVLLF